MLPRETTDPTDPPPGEGRETPGPEGRGSHPSQLVPGAELSDSQTGRQEQLT